MVEKSEQIVREAPEIEAYKVGLLRSAKDLADRGIQIPPQLVAQMSGLQVSAIDLAQAGIGGYQPYLQEAGYTLGDAQTALGGAMAGALPFQDEAAGLMRTGVANVPGQLAAAQQGMAGAALAGGDVADAARAGGQNVMGALNPQLAASTQAGRGITSEAAQALQQAGALGTTAAQQGIAGLAGTTGAFDPSSAGGFMNQFEDAAVQRALADIARQGQIAQQGVAAQAVGAGAFGGSRQAVAEQELQRNVLEQQGRTAAQMRQAGFESATQRAQAAFESQQGRSQQAAQLTGALGAQGAQAGLSAAQTAGQLGLSGEQMASANAQALAQYGVNLESLAAQTGMSAAQLAGQLAGQSGQIGLQGQELMGRMGEGIGTLGTQYGQLGLQQGEALGVLGLRQGALGELTQQTGQREQAFLSDLGKTQQAQQQAELEAARASELQQLYEPYQRVGFLSDIYKGAPSTQQTITGVTAPTASTAQQVLGLGVAGLSAAAGAAKAGLF